MERNGEHQVTQLRADGKGNHSSKSVTKGSVRKPLAVVRPISGPNGAPPSPTK